jgi:hypothetical protein
VDAIDKNGEPIHQALMPKKMEKFAQSKDFRPFKFRIQAFTHAFIDEVIGFNPAVRCCPIAHLFAVGQTRLHG